MTETVELLPAENMALTVASSQFNRGETIETNVAGMLVMALERLTGKRDWTKEVDTGGV